MTARIATTFLLIGIIVGGLAVHFAPEVLSPYLPDAVQKPGDGISGPVVAKRLEGDRLLVTVAAQQGAILVTFRKKLSEIDLLVEEGDTVALGVKQYRPFMQDPELRAVQKHEISEPSPAEASPGEAPAQPVPHWNAPTNPEAASDSVTTSGRFRD